MKRGQRNAGFSLSEMLFVLALISILSGLAFVHIREHKKNFDFMESNETAKEIFLAAQERLSAAYTKRELHTAPDPANYSLYSLLNVKLTEAGDGAFGVPISGNVYALYMKDGAAASSASSGDVVSFTAPGDPAPLAYQTILPQGAIVTNQNYAILYDRDAYRVKCVFYTTADYDFSSWGENDWKTHLSYIDSPDGENYLKNFPAGPGRQIVMGFYSETIVPGGGSVGSGDNPLSPDDPFAPSSNVTTPPANGINPGLTIVNGPVLYALVTLDNSFDYSQVTLDLAEVGGSGSFSIPFANGASSSVWRVKETTSSTTTYVVVLDDVTRSALKFSDITGGRIAPGANVQATVNTTGKLKNASATDSIDGASDSVTCNSLFADGSDLSGTVHVQNFRHLQNLDKCGNSVGNVSAELDQSVGWSTFKDTDIPNYRTNIFPFTPDDSNANISYDPVSPQYKLAFRSANNRLYSIMGLALPGGDAGLFGTVSHDATIERIQLQGVKIETGQTPANAGALIGKVESGTVNVNQVASYGESWATSGENGVATTITASNNAGGLIGAVAGGNVTLTECAAAHLADAGTSGNAGGLVGSVTGGALTIERSYAGSGTINDKGNYPRDASNNLQADVRGAYAGGLVGQKAGGATLALANVYSVASASGRNGAGSLTGSATVTPTDKYYGRGEYQVTTGTDTKIKKDAHILYAMDKPDGRPYQSALLSDDLGGGKFPYQSIALMMGTGVSSDAPWWIATHMGDWPVRDKLEAGMWSASAAPAAETSVSVNGMTKTIPNDDARYAWISLKDVELTNTVTLAVSDAGDSPTKAVLYAFQKQADDTWTAVKRGVADASVTTWSALGNGEAKPSVIYSDAGPGAAVGELSASETKWLRVTLDDITTPRQRFKDLFPPSDLGLTPEKEIRVRAGVDANPLDFANLLDGSEPVRFPSDGSKAPDTGVVLYDIRSAGNDDTASLHSAASGEYAAAISNVRHLQNLDASVSGVGTAVTEAALAANLDGSAWQTRTIQLDNNKAAKSFYGISNANLTEFNGNNKTLTNFTIDRTADGANGPGATDAGLFRALNGATVGNLTLENFTVKASDGKNAGTLAASATGAVTVQNVTLGVDGDASQKANVSASGTGAAAGLIASASGAVTVENVRLYSPEIQASGTGDAAGLIAAASGATVENVRIEEPTVTAGTDGNAGGLIASATGATVENVRIEEPTVTAGTDGNAGGLIASASGAVNVDTVLVRSGNKDVSASGTGAAGGLVGNASGNLTLHNSAATMYVKAANGDAGGLVGTVAGGATTVTDSYAGGHTSGGKYQDADSDAGRWNVQSGAAAGGLVGAVQSGAALHAAQSFSAASAKGATAGGVIGATDGTLQFSDSVYAAGPVGNVTRQDALTQSETVTPVINAATNAGAFIGAGVGDISNALNKTFYLPQLYKDAKFLAWSGDGGDIDGSDIAYAGTDATREKIGYVTAVSYADDKSAISAKTAEDQTLLERATVLYDNAANGAEYPFKIWTKFAFDGDEAAYYYGDFQVVQNSQSVNYKVKFTYQLGDGAPEPILDASAEGTPQLVREAPYTEEDGLTVLPGAVPYADGYAFGRWELLKKDGTYLTLRDNAVSQYARLTITPEQMAQAQTTGNEITINARCNPDDNGRKITYLWAPDKAKFPGYDADTNPTPDYPTYAQASAAYETMIEQHVNIGETADKPYRGVTADKLYQPKPTLTGYQFDGWYKDGSFTPQTRMEFSESETVSDSLTLYAKFTKIRYCVISVDFNYQRGSETVPYAQRKYSYPLGRSLADGIPLLNTAAALTRVTRSVNGGAATELPLTEIDNNALKDPDATKYESVAYVVSYVEKPDPEQVYRIEYVMHHTKASASTPPNAHYSYANEEGKDADGNSVPVYFEGSDDDSYTYRPYDDALYSLKNIPADVGGEIRGFQLGTDVLDADGKPQPQNDYFMEDFTENGETVTVDGTEEHPFIIRYHYYRKSYPLEFNSLGGTNVDPIEVYFGETIDLSNRQIDGKALQINKGEANAPVRTGYTFNGWTQWKEKDAPDDDPAYLFDFASGVTRMPSEPKNGWVVRADWIGKTDTQYKVVFLRQKAKCTVDEEFSENNYEFVAMETRTGQTGALAYVTAEDKSYSNSKHTFNVGKTNEKEIDFSGFRFSRVEDGKKIAHDGTTFLNVYYDREVRTIFFYKEEKDTFATSSYTYYEQTTSTGSGLYGWVDDGFWPLTQGDAKETPDYVKATDYNDPQYGFVDGEYQELTLETVITWSYQDGWGNNYNYSGQRYVKEGRNSYSPTDGTTGELYGRVSGTYVKLNRSEKSVWRRPDGTAYDGNRYKAVPAYEWTYTKNNGETGPYYGDRFQQKTENGTYHSYYGYSGSVTYWKPVYSITELYGHPIGNEFKNTTAINNPSRWDAIDDPEYKADTPLAYIDIMPNRNITLHFNDPGDRKGGYIYYYMEALSGKSYTEPTTVFNNNLYFRSQEVKHKFNWLTYTEDVPEFDGYNKPLLSEAEPTFDANTGEAHNPKNFRGADKNGYGGDFYLYYSRKSFSLTFFDTTPNDDNTGPVGEIATTPIPFEGEIEDYANAYVTAHGNFTTSATAYDYTWDGNFYVNEKCDEKDKLTSEELMLSHDMVIYLKFTKEERTVRFTKANPYELDPDNSAKHLGDDAYYVIDGETVTTDPADIKVEDGGNVDDMVANPTGLNPPYKPMYPPATYEGVEYPKGIYKFDGWYCRYQENGETVEKKFNSGMAITKDKCAQDANGDWVLNLYPRWTDRRPKKGSVQIKCFYTDENGGRVLLPFKYGGSEYPLNEAGTDYATPCIDTNVTVGAPYAVSEIPDIISPDNTPYRYKPGSRYAFVLENKAQRPALDENVIWMEYECDGPWTYNVEYYARLGNTAEKGDDSWIDGDFNDPPADILILSSRAALEGGGTKSITTRSQYQTVTFDAPIAYDDADPDAGIFAPPAGYSHYRLLGYQYLARRTVEGTVQEIDLQGSKANPASDYSVMIAPDEKGGEIVVRFYIAPDTDLITLKTPDEKPYDGKNYDKWDIDYKALESEALTSAGVQYAVHYQCWDMATKTALNEGEKPTNAGVYAETAYVTATYNAGEGEKRVYLVWKSADYERSELSLYVTPRAVTLESASGEWKYDADNPIAHTKAEVRVTAGEFVAGEVELLDGNRVPNEIITYAVDAFRRNPGVTNNVFDVNFAGNSALKAENYAITKKYGTLKVNE